ncbi:MAG: hypothetical protein FWG93_02970 [Oscillospiraceae bacterium]|nr:hypothetical protein [Oscillospiraceae bacterium]
MKRNFISIALLVTLLVTLPGVTMLAVSAGNAKTDARREVESVVEAYLVQYAEYMYIGIEKDISSDTLMKELENPSAALINSIAALDAFRKDAAWDTPEGFNVMGAGAEAFQKNLKLQEDRLAYARYMNEAYGIAYESFTPTYTFHHTVVSGDLAMTDVWEKLYYQYAGVDFTSAEGRNYRVSLIKINGIWKIAEIISDDEFFQAHRDGDFDLESTIRDHEAVFEQQSEIAA